MIGVDAASLLAAEDGVHGSVGRTTANRQLVDVADHQKAAIRPDRRPTSPGDYSTDPCPA